MARRTMRRQAELHRAWDERNFAEMETRRAHAARHAAESERDQARRDAAAAEAEADQLREDLLAARSHVAYRALDQVRGELRDSEQARAVLAARLAIAMTTLDRYGLATGGPVERTPLLTEGDAR
ncbi:hypothetical protein V2J56_09075 [Georgenia sp. MJ206]|uniref:hypothetical protein n=1 Tax=Georgenia wangjunii TaxID=3117730 RepID=UPI002F262CF4